MYEKGSKKEKKEEQIQLVMNFQDEKENPIEAKLKGLDLLRMTPIEALNTLYELKTEIEHNK